MGYLGKDKETNYLQDESQRVFRRLVEDLRVGIYMADAKGDLFYANSAFVRILGYQSKDEIIGLNVANELYVHPEDREKFLKDMEKVGFVKNYEIVNKRKDGSIVHLSSTSNFIRNDKDEIIGVEGVVYDITEHQRLEKQSFMLFNAIEQTEDHIMITDKEGTIEYVNPSLEKCTGYSKEELIGQNPRILKSGKHDKEFFKKLWEKILSGKVFEGQIINKKKDGRIYVSDQTISPIRNKFGVVEHFVSVWKDVTGKTLLQHRLKVEKAKLEEIINFDEEINRIRKLDNLLDFIVEKTAKILEAKTCTLMLLDEETDKLCLCASVGVDDKEITKDEIKISRDDFVGSVMLEKESLLIQEGDKKKSLKNEKSPYYLGKTFMIAPLKVDEKLIGIITVADRDEKTSDDRPFSSLDLKILEAISREVGISIENVRLYRKLNYLTVTDPLTKIYNYRYFTSGLDQEIKRANRFKRTLTLLMMDVDDFKAYNDNYGHLEGDKLLKAVGDLLKECFREIDIVCRYAGDEFVVILPETQKDGADIIAQKIQQEAKKLSLKSKITLSIGGAQWSEKMDRRDLILKADQALYESKKKGKNCITIYA